MRFGFCFFLPAITKCERRRGSFKRQQVIKNRLSGSNANSLQNPEVSFFTENSICWQLELSVSYMVILFHNKVSKFPKKFLRPLSQQDLNCLYLHAECVAKYSSLHRDIWPECGLLFRQLNFINPINDTEALYFSKMNILSGDFPQSSKLVPKTDREHTNLD